MKRQVIDIASKNQIDMLGKYFPIDHEKRIVTIKIYYDKASDLLDFTIGELKMELFSNEVFEKMSDIIDKIPNGYKANVIFVVEDYEGYDPELLLSKLNDKIEINNYVLIRERRKRWFFTVVLVSVGLAILFFLQIAKNFKWLGEGIKADILVETFDIISWVFIWEAVTVLFLSESYLGKVQIGILKRVNKITFSSKKEKELLSERIDSVTPFTKGTKKLDVLNILLLVTSTFLIVSSVYGLVTNVITDVEDTIDTINNPNLYIEGAVVVNIVILVVDALLSISQGILGFFGIRIYRTKSFPKVALYVLASIFIGLIVTQVVLSATGNDFKDTIKAFIDLVIMCIFVFASFRIDHLRKHATIELEEENKKESKKKSNTKK